MTDSAFVESFASNLAVWGRRANHAGIDYQDPDLINKRIGLAKGIIRNSSRCAALYIVAHNEAILRKLPFETGSYWAIAAAVTIFEIAYNKDCKYAAPSNVFRDYIKRDNIKDHKELFLKSVDAHLDDFNLFVTKLVNARIDEIKHPRLPNTIFSKLRRS